MASREISTLTLRVAAAAALALALGACGGGGAGADGSIAGRAGASASASARASADGQAAALGEVTARIAQSLAAAAPESSAAAALPAAPEFPAASAKPLRSTNGNLLANGTFESGMAGWMDWDNAQAIDGTGASGSWRALRVGMAAGGAGHDVSGGILSGTRYRLTGQVRVTDPSDVVFIGINILDQWGNTVAQQAVPVSTTSYSVASLEVETPANAVKAVVFVWKNAGNGHAYVDDLVLTPVSASSAPVAGGGNLVSNNGFESALANWTDWGNASAVTGQSSSGSYSVRVGNGAGGLGHDVASVVGGKTYSLTGKVKVSDAAEVAYLGLSFFDPQGNKLLEENVPFSSTSWFAAKLDLAAPANASKAMVYVWKNAGSGFAYVDDVGLAPVDGATAVAPAPAPTPAPAPVDDIGLIPVQSWPGTLLQVGRDNDAYWVEDGVWGPWGLTRDTFTGIGGTTYEQYIGVSPEVGANGEVAFRLAWKWPSCCTEIKSFPSIISGAKPGFYNSWTTPAGLDLRLLDGSYSQKYPSGATPGTFFPLQLPIASLKTTANYRHVSTPTGRGHLAYDIFLQSSPTQVNGFGTGITHEIIIPLDYWGGYGEHGTRNPGWYDHDVTIDGRLFHVYAGKDSDGALRATWGGGWKFIVFEPSKPIPPGTQLDLAKFINYTTTRRDVFGTPWANGNEYAVSVELGVEPQEGVGDIQVTNYRVWR
jgi:hypothetical protein